MTKAVIWDMDGVLVDTGPFHFRAWSRLLRERGTVLTEREFLGSFGMRSVDILRKALGDLPAAELRALASRKEEYYREGIAGHIQPLPGAKAALAAMAGAGYRQALASSAPLKNIGLILESVGIGGFFEAVVSGDEVVAGKPDPQIFLEAARRLGVAPEQCVVVEDALAGVSAAKAAGMGCVAVTTTNPAEKLGKAELVLDSLEQLSPDLIEPVLQRI